jgi:tRNA-2-methylthio-N6-dimethylallyladenosine synthase
LGRKDAVTRRLSGRARDNRLVHIAQCDAEPGDLVCTTVTRAAPHHLLADLPPITIRRRRRSSGEAVLLGLPTVSSS